jgi:hypothetical protein
VKTRSLALLAVLMALAAIAVPAPAGAAPPHRILVQEHFGSGEELFYRPHRFYLSGDGTFFMQAVRWRRYGGRVATANATYEANDCIPFCYSGDFSVGPAKLRLTRPVHCQAAGIDAYIYTRLSFRLLGEVPKNFNRKGSISLRPVGPGGNPLC